ncbi:I-Kappa-B like protein [Trichinella spiralis]|uniref:I-Kappa-B like protein n=1 Tax=Trichinella spiralis TaxID=6334 RepID=A0ABR3K723_TRISP
MVTGKIELKLAEKMRVVAFETRKLLNTLDGWLCKRQSSELGGKCVRVRTAHVRGYAHENDRSESAFRVLLDYSIAVQNVGRS